MLINRVFPLCLVAVLLCFTLCPANCKEEEDEDELSYCAEIVCAEGMTCQIDTDGVEHQPMCVANGELQILMFKSSSYIVLWKFLFLA